MTANEPKTFPFITINNRRLFAVDVEVSPTSATYTAKQHSLTSEASAVTFLRRQIVEGEYVGECTVIKYSRPGHLVKLRNSAYAVLSPTYTVFYVSSFITDFQMIPTNDDAVVDIAGEKVDVAKLEMSGHFMRNVAERLRLPEDSARAVLIDTVVNGTYIGITHDKEERKPAHLFAKAGKLIYISLDLETAMTVYTNGFAGNFIHPVANETIVNALKQEVNKLMKQEKDMERRNYACKLHSNLKIAQNDLDRYRCRKEEKIVELTREIEEERQSIIDNEKEWEDLVDRLRQNAIALAAFV